MLERVRIEKARVQMTLLYLDANGRERHRIPIQNGATLPQPNEFLYLRTKVVNLSGLYGNLDFCLNANRSPPVAPLTLTLDFTVEPAEHIIVEGVLTDVSLGRLDSGEYREIETVLCVLCLGRFEICVTVRSLSDGSAGTVVGAGCLRAVVRGDDR
jgi:trafficking protein particle complex subunit 9